MCSFSYTVPAQKKSKTMCFTSCIAKAPVYFSLLDKKWYEDPDSLVKTTILLGLLSSIMELHKPEEKALFGSLLGLEEIQEAA